MVSSAKNYQRSNRITTVKLSFGEQAISHARNLLILKDLDQRQTLGQSLLDELCDAAQIDICNVKVSDTQQYHRRAGGRVVFKQYGYYRPRSRYIYIQNRTAVRGQVLAAKTFLDTLLHEWLHHYDTLKLGLNSIHTSGFYQRLKDLKAKLGII